MKDSDSVAWLVTSVVHSIKNFAVNFLMNSVRNSERHKDAVQLSKIVSLHINLFVV
jgi:hypothetical protein